MKFLEYVLRNIAEKKCILLKNIKYYIIKSIKVYFFIVVSNKKYWH